MKITLKTRALSAVLALTILFTACGTANTTDTNNVQDTETVSVPVETEQQVTIEKEEVDIVTSSAEPEEPEYTEEEKEWLDKVMADVEDNLNVRAEADAESELAGKLTKGDVATVLEIGEEWTKIKSGKLKGYIKNEYCIYGLEALAYAKENCDTVATTTVDGLRIREKMNTDSKVIARLDENEKLVVNTKKETKEGWVAVKYSGSTYYVSSEYVTVAMDLGQGLTVEEIEEQQRKEAEEKAKAEAAAKQSSSTSTTTTSSDLADVDDVTLLAAIIYCEAGGSSYECKLAVASVIMNRVNSSKYPNTLRGVLFQSGQFPPATNGKLENRLATGKVTESCYKVAKEALAGKNNAKGCYRFNDYNGSQKGMRIDGMIFW